MKQVEETIDTICDWLQGEIKENAAFLSLESMAGMTKALAELVEADAKHSLKGINVKMINEKRAEYGLEPIPGGNIAILTRE